MTHVDDESKIKDAAREVTGKTHARVDKDCTTAPRDDPEVIKGGHKHGGNRKVVGVVISKNHVESGYAIIARKNGGESQGGEVIVYVGTEHSGFEVIHLMDGDRCMLDGASGRCIR